jgi:hypothetical protein
LGSFVIDPENAELVGVDELRHMDIQTHLLTATLPTSVLFSQLLRSQLILSLNKSYFMMNVNSL